MQVKYSKDTDLLYIHLHTGVSNVLIPTDNECISKFVSKKDRSVVVGYEIEEASKNLDEFLSLSPLNSKQKLAVALSYIRNKNHKTQKEFALAFGISEGSYKSLERAEHNITFETLDRIFVVLKNESEIHHVFKIA